MNKKRAKNQNKSFLFRKDQLKIHLYLFTFLAYRNDSEITRQHPGNRHQYFHFVPIYLPALLQENQSFLSDVDLFYNSRRHQSNDLFCRWEL